MVRIRQIKFLRVAKILVNLVHALNNSLRPE